MKSQKQIIKYLKEIFILDGDLNEEITKNLGHLSDEQLEDLEGVLAKVYSWQTDVINQKIKTDPSILSKIDVAESSLRQDILRLYQEQVLKNDQAKIKEILAQLSNK